MIVKYKFPRS